MTDVNGPGRSEEERDPGETDAPTESSGSEPTESAETGKADASSPATGADSAAEAEPELQQADAEIQEAEERSQRGFVSTFFGFVTTANTFMVTVYSFLLAMVIGAVLIIVSDPAVRGTFTYFFSRPGDALGASWDAVSSAYAGLFSGAILNFETLGEYLNGETALGRVLAPISETLTFSAPLILAGLAVGLAFRAGLFNIGAQGQVIMGTVGAAVVGFGLGLPMWLHLPLALLGGALAGALFGAVPGALKAWTGAHEVITSIMLNYVALAALGWIIGTKFVKDPDPDKRYAISKAADETAILPRLSDVLGINETGLRANVGILIAIAAGLVVAWLLSKSTLGFRMRSVGLNADASRTAGMSVPNTYITTMGLAGGLAGLAGAVTVLGISPYALTHGVAGQIGFDGITVALLGRAKPGGVIAAGLLFGAMRAGASTMQSIIPIDMVTLLQALIVIFIAAPALVKAMLRLKVPAGGLATSTAKGW